MTKQQAKTFKMIDKLILEYYKTELCQDQPCNICETQAAGFSNFMAWLQWDKFAKRKGVPVARLIKKYRGKK